jgi:hypothetical protein
MVARCCRRSRGGHREGVGQGEGRGAPERWVDGEAAQTASSGGVRRWGGGSGGWRRQVWGPAAPERQGGEKIARKCRDWQLGEELTGEWRTAAVLGRNPRGRVGCQWLEAAVRVWGAVGRLRRSRGGVGEEWRREDEWSSASGERAARRQRGKGEKRREKVGVRAWGCHAARGCCGAWPRLVDGARQRPERGTRGRRAPRVCCRRKQRGERRLTGGMRHSAADRRGRPISGCGDSAGGTRARVGWPEKKAGWPSPDEQ